MNKTEVIRVRVDTQLKEEATEVLDSLGLTVSAALRLFLIQVVAKKALPFNVEGNIGPMTNAQLIACLNILGLTPHKHERTGCVAVTIRKGESSLGIPSGSRMDSIFTNATSYWPSVKWVD